MKKKLLLGLLFFASTALATERMIMNPESNGDLKIKANIAGTPTDAITVTGTTGVTTLGQPLPVASGGTASTSAQTAINTLAGSQTNNRVLRGNGTNVVVGQIDATGFFTSGALADTSSNAGIVNPYSAGTGVVYAATCTLSPSNTSNLTSSTQIGCHYIRVGKIVTVYGAIDADPTNAATITDCTVNLPVASNLTATADLEGVASQRQVGGVYVAGAVVADTGNDRAIVRWVSGSDVSQRDISFTFTYEVK